MHTKNKINIPLMTITKQGQKKEREQEGFTVFCACVFVCLPKREEKYRGLCLRGYSENVPF